MSFPTQDTRYVPNLDGKAQTTRDAELLALAAMTNVEAVVMAGDNAARASRGEAPAWTTGCGFMAAGTALYDELYKRGYNL